MIVRLSFLFPARQTLQRRLCPHRTTRTLDRVCLHELCTVGEEVLCDRFPRHTLRHAQVDVCRREFVDVKPDILRPGVLDEVFICRAMLLPEFTWKVVDQE